MYLILVQTFRAEIFFIIYYALFRQKFCVCFGLVFTFSDSLSCAVSLGEWYRCPENPQVKIALINVLLHVQPNAYI